MHAPAVCILGRLVTIQGIILEILVLVMIQVNPDTPCKVQPLGKCHSSLYLAYDSVTYTPVSVFRHDDTVWILEIAGKPGPVLNYVIAVESGILQIRKDYTARHLYELVHKAVLALGRGVVDSLMHIVHLGPDSKPLVLEFCVQVVILPLDGMVRRIAIVPRIREGKPAGNILASGRGCHGIVVRHTCTVEILYILRLRLEGHLAVGCVPVSDILPVPDLLP